MAASVFENGFDYVIHFSLSLSLSLSCNRIINAKYITYRRSIILSYIYAFHIWITATSIHAKVSVSPCNIIL